MHDSLAARRVPRKEKEESATLSTGRRHARCHYAMTEPDGSNPNSMRKSTIRRSTLYAVRGVAEYRARASS